MSRRIDTRPVNPDEPIYEGMVFRECAGDRTCRIVAYQISASEFVLFRDGSYSRWWNDKLPTSTTVLDIERRGYIYEGVRSSSHIPRHKKKGGTR